MASLPLSPSSLLPDGTETRSLDEVADHLGVSANRVRTLVRDHHLLAVSVNGAPEVPVLFLGPDGLAKHYTGIVDVLLDGGYTRDEVVAWLFTVHDDLGIHPAQALHTDFAREVIRRAQAQAF